MVPLMSRILYQLRATDSVEPIRAKQVTDPTQVNPTVVQKFRLGIKVLHGTLGNKLPLDFAIILLR